jgi:hypothetical protein
MAAPAKSTSELKADLVDVHILDLAAHLEAMLHGIRDLQRGALRLRGVNVGPDRGEPSDLIRARLARMLEECTALHAAVSAAAVEARTL